MKTITIANQKGGVAKTTTAWHLGVGLARKGFKILLVDIDPQSNLSFTANVDLLNVEHSLFDVFKGEATAKEALIKVSDNIDILVGGIDLAAADRTFTQLAREKMLGKALKPLQGLYDYCIIDTPPTLGVMNENALTCSDFVIVPIQAEIYALQGINQLQGFIDDIKENTNPKLAIAGILITRVNERTNLHGVLYPQFEKAAARMNTKIFDTVIRSTISVGEAALERTNLFDYESGATATKDYIDFVNEFIDKIG
jgi:chromosome partitioning protein